MDSSHFSSTESHQGEAFTRQSPPSAGESWSITAIRGTLDKDSWQTLHLLASTFSIREPATGLMALMHEITADLVILRTVFKVPPWTNRLDTLHTTLCSLAWIDRKRDLNGLHRQPRSALRGFLTPFAPMRGDQHRAMRAVRGLVTLHLLSKKEHLGSPLAEQLRRCITNKSLQHLGLGDMTAERIRLIGRGLPVDSPEARLLTLILAPLESEPPDPFQSTHAPAPSHYMDKVVKVSSLSSGIPDGEITPQPKQPTRDPLQGFLAEEKNAKIKIFSGIPDLYRTLLPFELESIFPRMKLQQHNEVQDEYLATWLTLLTRVMPQHFDRVPLHAPQGAGLWIDIERGYVAWNLDEILASHKSETPFVRAAGDQYFLIPIPIEIHHELQQRLPPDGNKTMASLFKQQAKNLGVSTKRFLRELSISSHRPTLTRLTDSWSRYLLHICRDEAYASALGIDFTVGTPSNFHYATFRGERICAILAEAYRRLGFSGELSCEVPDIHARRLPDQAAISALVVRCFQRVAESITQFPKRAAISKLKAVHNNIALDIYTAFKCLSGGRALKEETVTYSRIDLTTGLTELSDKRTSHYHERRVVCLPPTLCSWMRTYVSWLRLIAYRIAPQNRHLAEAILSTLDTPLHGERLPFFFQFKGQEICSMGSANLAPLFDAFGLKNNSGRHFIDEIFRSEKLDSAAIMGWMGRGYPGQEIYGRYSAAIPLTPLTKCANGIENWLGKLSLPQPPILAPRTITTAIRSPKHKIDPYVPALLHKLPASLTVQTAGISEPCPYQGHHVLEASFSPRLYQTWRSAAPPPGWPGVAMSLVFEDAVLINEELFEVINEMQHGIVYRYRHHYFVDARTPTYGIRRVWLSAITVRLLHQIRGKELEGADPAAIDITVQKFLAKALPNQRNTNGIYFIQRALLAFEFFRIPVLLHAWIRGEIFSRVSRPQVVAREILGFCEHPSFEQRCLRHDRLRFNDFSALHRKAYDALDKGGADKTVLAQFEHELAKIQPNHDPESFEHLLIGYARYLCSNQITLSSVSRYLTACRPLLYLIVSNLSANGWDHIDWQSLVQQSLERVEHGRDKAADRAAVNHCLCWLGIDERAFRRKGPPPSAFNYAERMTEREGKTAIWLLRSKRRTPGDLWHRSSVALSLLLAVEIRWDELACLRMGDFCLESGRAHLVVTPESGARLKSANARRVIPLTDAQLVTDLAELYAQREARFPSDPLVPFFGDETEIRSHASLDQVHDLIADGLWCASGSEALRIHDTRAAGLTQKVGNLLEPTPGETLDLRQASLRLSCRAGHSVPEVSVQNYVHNLDVKRRHWQDKVLSQFLTYTRPAFATGITSISEATYRQRARRTSPTGEKYDFWEGFDEDQALETGATVRELDDFVVPGVTVVADLAEQQSQSELVAAWIYVGLSLLGEPSDSARLAAALTIKQAEALETRLSALQRGRITPLRGHAGISRDEFIAAAIKNKLVVAMHATSPSTTIIRHLVTVLNVVGTPWEILVPEDLLEAAAWLDPLRAAGIETRIQLKSLGQSRQDDYRLGRFSSAGLRARVYPARDFPRGIAGRVKFGRLTAGSKASQFKSSTRLTYLVTTSVLTIWLLMEKI